jgi:hypothetical protein
MNTKMMKMGAFLCAVALTVSGCFKLTTPESKYELNLQIHYEPDNEYDVGKFMQTFFNDGADSVSVHEYLTVDEVITHNSKVDAKNELIGGFAMCIGIDTIATPDRRPQRYAVFDDGGYGKSLAYVVYHDTLSTLLPEHSIDFYVPNEQSTCKLKNVFVQNVQAVVQAVKHGTGLAGGPFTDGDFLTMTFIGVKGGQTTGTKVVKLVDGTQLLGKWTEVDLSSLGYVEHLDLHMESSRPDCPLYCCLDNLAFHLSITE